ncbi:MAG: sulfite exporter TauE/SafE family protein [Phycisphaerales bacterium]
MDFFADSNLTTMLPLIGAVLAASILGSLHCAGMCGGLMFFALGSDSDHASAARAKLQAAYHGGRLVTYTLLGVAAGAIGQAVNFGGSYIGLQRLAAILAGTLMIGFGVVTLARLRGLRIARVRVPAPMRRFVERAQRAAFSLTPFKRAATIGLLTTLLPCGWLYAFAFTAAGTASPVWGGLTMAAFWVGTLPVMVSLGAGIQFLSAPLHARLPVITATAVVIVGVMTAMGRLHAPEMSRANLGLAAAAETNTVPTSDSVDCPLCEAAAEPEPAPATTTAGAGG